MVFIKELLPNPVGRDTEGEWIKLVNTGEAPVEIGGWRLSDASGKEFVFRPGETVAPKSDVLLEYSQTGIVLNNNGDTIKLEDNKGETVDTLAYSGQIGDDEIIIAERFIEVINKPPPSQGSLQELAFVGQGALVTGASTAPLFVALALAATLGVAVGFLQKRMHEE